MSKTKWGLPVLTEEGIDKKVSSLKKSILSMGWDDTIMYRLRAPVTTKDEALYKVLTFNAHSSDLPSYEDAHYPTPSGKPIKETGTPISMGHVLEVDASIKEWMPTNITWVEQVVLTPIRY